MINELKNTEKELGNFLNNPKVEIHSMYIDYHEPFVQRIWFQDGPNRVYLHKIEPCNLNQNALYHPHPWKSAVRTIHGAYEMGIGHSNTDKIPATDCRLILNKDTIYEMIEEDAWHYIRPINGPVYSLMVTGFKNNRKMPIEPNKKFRKLTEEEFVTLLSVFEDYYQFKNFINPVKLYKGSL